MKDVLKAEMLDLMKERRLVKQKGQRKVELKG